MTWQDDKRFADAYLPDVKAILGVHLIGEASEEEDKHRNTDLVVLTLRNVRIACRIRKPGFFDKYGGQFTIRADRPNGAMTELAKIVSGWGDFFFYGHVHDDLGSLRAWGLCDLMAFRLWFNGRLVRDGGRIPGEERRNSDGSSSFRCFAFNEMSRDFLIASHGIGIPTHERMR